ncbi:Rpn family recombination-promoting nuclease/putative transposase [Oscillatoria sp. FACHB-1406]|uniref:Rpn family recombination-promoting nuclease/putative transposase n=1 Tax=Oscillatoria sp. FACHB-1406 TaxID=2692846 RepID=UPI0016871566|nr:Rpn family recombination-promoting nuclease/putative transposase [Oscillatoria sp. FACHB-1406]MBD2577493.1 Rpn family recombination-promoting nuclease/putative transposase [Oscillatoria sp. FACHB-1406]
MRFINPKTDYAFKKIFGSSESKNILISFLNALIYNGNSTIQDLEIINPNLPPKLEGLKDTYLDVKAKLQNGITVIIEMQVLNVQSFAKRVIFNAAKTYAFQLQSGEGYRMLKPVIALTLTDFIMFPEREKYTSRYSFKETTDNKIYPDNEIELVFVELPKFTKELEQLETLAEKWIYFIKSARSLDAIPENMEEITELNQAFGIANQAGLSQSELEDIERREMFIYDQQGAIALGREEGREQGIEEGRAVGLEEGREEGREEALRDVARNLLDRFDDDTIAQMTGLSLETVRDLRSES